MTMLMQNREYKEFNEFNEYRDKNTNLFNFPNLTNHPNILTANFFLCDVLGWGIDAATGAITKPSQKVYELELKKK